MKADLITVHPSARGLIRVQGEADPLQHPVRNVPRREEVGLKHQADAHGVPSGGGGVDRRPEGVLQRKGGEASESETAHRGGCRLVLCTKSAVSHRHTR